MPARSRRSRRSTLALGCSFVLFAVAGATTDALRTPDRRSEAFEALAGRSGEVGDEGTMGGLSAATDGMGRTAMNAKAERRVLDEPTARQRPRSIAITSSLPSTDSLTPAFSATYDSLFESLSADTESLVSSATSSISSRLRGIPGTAITSLSEARDLQSFLDCSSSSGEWVYDPSGKWLASQGRGLTVHKQESRYAACDKRFYKGREPGSAAVEAEGGWDVRESLKWRWLPSASCANLAPASLSPSLRSSAPPSRSRFCGLLAHKSTLLLGDSTQYSLHDLLLDWTTTEPQSCYGDLYCKEHALCGEILRSRNDEGVEDWESDERVYHRLPVPPGEGDLLQRREEQAAGGVDKRDSLPSSASHDSVTLAHTHAKRQSRSPSYGTLLRYRRTDGLRPSSAQTLPTYKHPSTGVREVNQPWLADSRRSDVVILNKPPLPLPRKGFNQTFDEWVREVMGDERAEVERKALRIVEAAAETTRRVWVPELVEALRAIRAPPSPPDQLVVYRGGWRQHVDCAASAGDADAEDSSLPTSPGDGPPPRSTEPSLSDLLFRSDGSLRPLHVIYHNAQLFFQNHLARTVVLPAFGVPFLDLDSPLSVWRSGMVGSSSSSVLVSPSNARSQTVLASQAGAGLRNPTSGDCTRYCFPSPGLSLETFFLGALHQLYEAGWAGDEGREGAWVGDEGFRNLRERVARQEALAE